jgi:hypothetical protein
MRCKIEKVPRSHWLDENRHCRTHNCTWGLRTPVTEEPKACPVAKQAEAETLLVEFVDGERSLPLLDRACRWLGRPAAGA